MRGGGEAAREARVGELSKDSLCMCAAANAEVAQMHAQMLRKPSLARTAAYEKRLDNNPLSSYGLNSVPVSQQVSGNCQ